MSAHDLDPARDGIALADLKFVEVNSIGNVLAVPVVLVVLGSEHFFAPPVGNGQQLKNFQTPQSVAELGRNVLIFELGS